MKKELTIGFDIDFLLGRLEDASDTQKIKIAGCMRENGVPCTPARAKELLLAMKERGKTSVGQHPQPERKDGAE